MSSTMHIHIFSMYLANMMATTFSFISTFKSFEDNCTIPQRIAKSASNEQSLSCLWQSKLVNLVLKQPHTHTLGRAPTHEHKHTHTIARPAVGPHKSPNSAPHPHVSLFSPALRSFPTQSHANRSPFHHPDLGLSLWSARESTRTFFLMARVGRFPTEMCVSMQIKAGACICNRYSSSHERPKRYC